MALLGSISAVAAPSLTINGEEGNKTYDVGTYSVNIETKDFIIKKVTGVFEPVLLSDNAHTVTYGDITLTQKDKLGAFNNGALITSFGKYELEGLTVSLLNNTITYHKVTTTATVSNNLNITGTLTVGGEAQVALGGQVATTQYAEFACLQANVIVAKDKASINSWSGVIGDLTVQNNATVNLHTHAGQGNSYFCLQGARDSKQTQIKRSITVTGGTLNIGHSGTIYDTNSNNKDQNPDTEYHTNTTFGNIIFSNPQYSSLTGDLTNADNAEIVSAQLHQTAGAINVLGKSASVGGLNITQEGGTMNISTAGTSQHTWHFLSDYGDSEIIQSGENSELNIGGIKAYNSKYDSVVDLLEEKGVTYNIEDGKLSTTSKEVEINPSISISQTGSGTINIHKGIIFTNQKTGAASTEMSSITQSGGGTINLNGTYEGATFNITQKENGGTIALNGNMTANVVNQSAGTLEIADKVTLTADSVSVGSDMKVYGELVGAGDDSLLTIVGQGHLTNDGAIDIDISMESGTLTAVDGSTFADVVATSGTIYLGNGVTFGALTLGSNAEIAMYTMRNTQNGVTVYVDKGGAIADNVTLGNNVKFVVETEGTADELVGQNITIFQKQEENGTTTTYDLTGATVFVKDSTGTETEVKFADNKDGSVTVSGSIPEPTTATLSLLALAALAARRRRK